MNTHASIHTQIDMEVSNKKYFFSFTLGIKNVNSSLFTYIDAHVLRYSSQHWWWRTFFLKQQLKVSENCNNFVKLFSSKTSVQFLKWYVQSQPLNMLGHVMMDLIFFFDMSTRVHSVGQLSDHVLFALVDVLVAIDEGQIWLRCHMRGPTVPASLNSLKLNSKTECNGTKLICKTLPNLALLLAVFLFKMRKRGLIWRVTRA